MHQGARPTGLGLTLQDDALVCDDRVEDQGGPGPLAVPGTPPALPSLIPPDLGSFEDKQLWVLERMLLRLQQLAVLIAPPQNVKVLDLTLDTDGPQTLLPNAPTGLVFWAIKNLGSNPILVWFVNTGMSAPNQNYVTISPGEYRAYATAPAGGIYAARTPGLGTDLQFEYWN